MQLLIGEELSFSELGELCDRDVKLVQLMQFDGTRAFLRAADGEEWWLTHPDMLCLGLVHSGPDGHIGDQLRDWWYKRSGVPLESCRLVPGEPEEARRRSIAEWLARRLIGIVSIMGDENKSLLNQNRQLRRSYGALQTTFQRLEQFVTANNLHRPILQYEPNRLASYWKPERPAEMLTQVLPVLSTRLSYFELNFQKSLNTGPGDLHIVLRLEPAGNVVQQWMVPYADVLTGWNSFSPAATVDEPNEVLLECTWSDVAGAPAIGLSAPHWQTPYAFSSSARDGPSSSIGVRVWSGLPGVRPPSLTNAPAESDKPVAVTLSSDELVGATQHKFATTVERDFLSVRYLEKLGRLMVHPHVGVPTIARLPSALPEGITAVSADVTVAETEEAPDIEYAMAILAPEVAPEAVFIGGDEPTAGFSGWLLCTSEQTRRIAVSLDRPTGVNMHLFLATRLPSGSSESFAWGTWGAIEIGYPPRRAKPRRSRNQSAGRRKGEPDPIGGT